MTMTGGALVVRALEDEGITLAFGIPGTHNIELYDALAESDTVRPVLVTDEQSAGFMADGAWRASGRMACVNIVPGAGLTHAMSGIAEAFMDNVPMLVLACGIRRDTGRRFQLHDVDQMAMARPVTKAQLRPVRGEEIYRTVREACRIARAGAPGPVLVEIPANLYLFRHESPLAHEAAPAPIPAPAPDEREIRRAADLLNDAKRPLLYVGLGAAGADLVALAERLEAPVATTFQGKGVFPESHPLALWPGFGDAAPPFARGVAAGCDATLAIGCRFGEVATGSYGLTPPAPLIHVDIEPSALGANHPAEVGIAADAAAFVRALLPLLAPRDRSAAMREAIRAGREDVARGWESAASRGRVTPSRLLRALQRRLGPDTVFTSDSGNGTFLAMECLTLDRPGRFLAPVDYSCMGYAVPAAIGARLALPDAPVVALAGDGAFLMTGLELLTAAQRGVPVMVFVLRDRELAQIAQFQSVAMNRKTCSVLPDYDLAAICRGVGVTCLALDRDADIDGVLDRAGALAGEGQPVVVDTAVDYASKTYFTRGVVRTNLARLPWPDRLRFIGRAAVRRLRGGGARGGW
ncbi:MAG TPA: thiamine pyrophosphate-binding protein [Gemmatimonadaceae bacterium]|nr:thiamine pyrophosphate-binding protein [Gemmatimonadaceae bacterium]